MSLRSLVAATAVASSATIAGAVALTAPAAAAPSWAPADSAKIHPGVQMYTNGAQCTSNFVFTDANDNVYVGYAAHCAGTGGSTQTNGCETDSLPLGTRVTFNEGGSPLSNGTVVGEGELAYSSWRTMQANGETNANACRYNDFALVEVDAADVSQVNPSMPFWGGPTGVNTSGTSAGDQVYSYGNSSLRLGIEQLSPKAGLSFGSMGGGWTHPLYNITPGIPGDSGSGFLDANGQAVGTLSTLGLAPLPASNNIGDMSRELAYAQQNSGIPGLELVEGTEPFSPLL